MRFSDPRLLFVFCSLVIGIAACSGTEGDDSDSDNDAATADVVSDAGEGDGDDDTFQPPVGRESLYVAYVTHTRGTSNPADEVWTLWVTDEDCESGTCDTTEVTGPFSCQAGCVISPEMDYLLWVDPDESQTLKIAALDSSFVVSDDVRTVAQNVDIWQVGPDTVVYSRSGTLYSQPLAGGSDNEIAALASQDGRGLPGGFHYAPQIGAVILSIPTSLSAMDLWEVPLDNPTESNRTLLYHFTADVEQTTGSFYQNQQQISVSPDGQYVAIFTEALDNSNSCSPASASDCDDEYRCSSNSSRCVSEQLLLHVINRSAVDQLDTSGSPTSPSSHRCTEDSECGQYHECDKSVVDAAGLGVCAPGKLVLGPYGRFACMDTAAATPFLDAGEYEHVNAGPMWRSDNNIIFVGRNSCVSSSIDATDIAAVDLSLNSIETIVSATGGNHGGPDCYDDVELDFTPAGCNVEVTRASMSPGGNTIVFLAGSVRSETDSEAWLVDAFGRSGKTDMTRDIQLEVLRVQVFDR